MTKNETDVTLPDATEVTVDMNDPNALAELEQFLGELPPLPDGFRWDLKVSADADVIHPDGSVN